MQKKFFQKITSIALTCCLLSGMVLPGFVSAASASKAAFTAVPSKTEVHPGDEVKVAVSVTPEGTVGAWEATVGYDNTKLEVVGDLEGDGITANPAYTENSVFATWSDTKPIKETREIFTVTFKVKENAELGDAGIDMQAGWIYDEIADELLPENVTSHTTPVTITEKPAEPVPVTGVSVSPESAEVFMGATTQLTATVAPENADIKDVTWSSSDESIATVNEDGLVTGIKAGNADITVTTKDGGKTAKAAITVKEDTVKEIVLKTAPTKLSYIEGEAFDPAGGVLTVTMEQGGTNDIPMTADMVKVDMNKVGEQDAAVSYGGKTLDAAFKVTIVKKEVTGIEVIQTPTGATYKGDAALNLEGGKIKVNYNNGTSDEKPMSDVAEVKGYDKNVVGAQEITITYGLKSATFVANVLYKDTVTTEDGTEVSVMGTADSKLTGDVVLNVVKKDVPAAALAGVKKLYGDKSEITRYLDITLTDADGNVIHDTGKIKIAVKLTDAEIALAKEGRLVVAYVDENGVATQMETEGYNGNGYLYFFTDHLSSFALVQTEQVVNPPAEGGGTGGNNAATDGSGNSAIKNPVTGLYFSNDEVNGFMFLMIGGIILAISGAKVMQIKKRYR
ncbi:Ig-like domain-containing protein [Eubacterium callanderi]|uniref:Ig-like domain-containing protein n=1 Tax=Eubacterium callanderi TaxID=53442 RepID=UPI00399B78C0